MHFFDIHNRFAWKPGSPPVAGQSNNNPIVSPIFDLQGIWGFEFQILCGALGSAGINIAVSGLEGNQANLSDGVAMVAASDIIGGAFPSIVQGVQDNTVVTIGYKPSIYRYIQFTLTPAGNSAALFIATAPIYRPKNYGLLM